jgi:curved DNA-binding protein CbpA
MNFYEILGLTQKATIEDIRSAYRRLARQHHPDITGHADAIQFREVRRAYETLCDPVSRADYDRSLQTRIPVRIVSSVKTNRYAEPLIPPRRFAETFTPQSPAEYHSFEEIFSLMERLFFRF